MPSEQPIEVETQTSAFTKISSEPFTGREHQTFTDYYDGKHGEPTYVPRKAIMDTWSDTVIISENIASCYPVIAFSPEGKCQMIHYSQDFWLPTEYDDFRKKIQEWKSLGCEVYLIKAPRTTALAHTTKLQQLFGSQYHQLDISEDTSYSLVIDIQKRQFLLNKRDTRTFDTYQI